MNKNRSYDLAYECCKHSIGVSKYKLHEIQVSICIYVSVRRRRRKVEIKRIHVSRMSR